MPLEPTSVAIVGGGVSGVLTAVHLLRLATAPLRVFLIEQHPVVGLGIAYGTPFPEHLLNVPVEGMSVFPQDPAHFCQWLADHCPGAYGPQDFAPRRVFGQYVRAVFEESLRSQPAHVELTIHAARAVDLRVANNRVVLTLSTGDSLTVDKAVLALGNYVPANPVATEPDWSARGWYFGNPWDVRLYDDVASLGQVLLIGSGLTALDVVVAYRNRGFRGTFHLVSTHGLLPRVHDAVNEHVLSFTEADLPNTLTVYHLYQLFKRELARAGDDWRAVIGALRPFTSLLWQRLPVTEQARFMRRLGPWWNVHRHRVAPSIATLVAELRAVGRLRLWKGRVVVLQTGGEGLCATVQTGGERVEVGVSRVVNCTGPQSDFNRIATHDPLVRSLLAQSLGRPDTLRAGLDALPNGQLIGADDQPSPFLFTLGTPMKGILFECTSVPEIRQHAEALAEQLLA